jgi:predicted amidohydrolase YtcJ
MHCSPRRVDSPLPEVEMAARLTAYVVVAIVAVTLIAGLIVGAQRDDNDGPVDLIVHNARLYTANDKGAMAEAVAIRGNQILRVGSDREIMRLKRPQTTTVDAKGAAVLPGFNDTHLDFLDGGALLDRIDLADAAAIEDVDRRIRDWAEANPDRPWVLGRGWHQDVFTQSVPTRQMLDKLVPDRPALLLSADGHTGWVNTIALRLAGIRRNTQSPTHGVIVRDGRTGEPTGILQGAAVGLIDRLLPPPTAAERDRALRAATAEAHRYGITSVQDVADNVDELAAYAEARRTGDLRVRVYAALPVVKELPDPELDRLEGITTKYPDDPLFKAGALNVVLEDDAPSAEASASADTSPSLHFQADDFNRLVRRLDARGWQILTDAASDMAVRMTLNAYDHAVRSNPSRKAERRHRIQNVESVAEEDLPRLSPLGILASMRPVEEDAAGNSAGPLLARKIGSGRHHLAFGSGWPAASLNPLLGLSAVLTPAPDAEAEDGARLSLKSAIDAYTSGAAWASFDEQRKGTLAPGMLADIVVLSDDIFKTPVTDLPAVRVEMTIFDGKIVYRRAQQATN